MNSILKRYLLLFDEHSLILHRSGKHYLFLVKCALLTFLITNCVGLFDSYLLIKDDYNYIDSYRFYSLGLFGVAIEDLLTSLIVYSMMAFFLWLPLKITARKNNRIESYKYTFILYIVFVFSIFELCVLFGDVITRYYDLHVMFSGGLFFVYFLTMFFFLANTFKIGSSSMKILSFLVFFISISFVCVIGWLNNSVFRW